MMSFHKHEPDAQAGALTGEKKDKSRSAIIKKDNANFANETVKINPYEISEIPENSGKITPLTNNDEIIGIIYECSCGEIAKVIFDFEASY